MLLPNEPEVDENGLETPWEHPPVVTEFLKYFNSSEMQRRTFLELQGSRV